ncbi:winged helix-turn-helix transcriptional regulator [Candidatus Nitrososphaera gargensis]
MKPSKRISEELGLTLPTINNRLQRMIRSRVLYSMHSR